MAKTLLSFYCDDTNPYCAPPAAFGQFLEYARAQGIAGEASLIPAFDWAAHGTMSPAGTGDQAAFLALAARANDCGIETNFELMTHAGRYDFAAARIPAGAQHEGVWLYEPAVSADEYQAYFAGILAAGDQAGVRYSGMTWPGCGCAECERRYAELRAQGVSEPNPNVWRALLTLAQAGRFRGHTVPCFFGGAVPGCQARVTASGGGCAVLDLPPNAEDRLALWLNDPAHADADYYITANGRAGRIVELVESNVPYCLFYAHWQGLNPANGLGWPVFTQVVERVRQHLAERIAWARPSEIAEHSLRPS